MAVTKRWTDTVQVEKQESSALGGSAAEDFPYPAPIDPREDGVELAATIFQDVSARDNNVFIQRHGNDLEFRDVTNPDGYTLSELGATPDVAQIAIEDGVTLAAGDCVAASTTLGRVTQAVAGSASNIAFLGICVVGGTGDSSGTVLAKVKLPGHLVIIAGAAYTAGVPLYLPVAAGPPTVTAPSTTGDAVQRLGYAHSATSFVLAPGPVVLL